MVQRKKDYYVFNVRHVSLSMNFTHRQASAHQSYDVNKRVVYAMRDCGQGHAGLETFTSLMNLPKPHDHKQL